MSKLTKVERGETGIRFPSIKDVASALVSSKRWCESGDEGGMDVRLQVHEDGVWAVHTGDSSYDQDHRGYWGSGYLTKRTNCRDLARDLISEAENDYYSSR